MPRLLLLALLPLGPAAEIRVTDSPGLYRAAKEAKPGTHILLEPGEYRGGIHLVNLHGSPGKPIVIRPADPTKAARIVGGGSALQLSDVSYVELRNFTIQRPQHNGLNIDDGGTPETPSHHVLIAGLIVTDTPAGNNDGIKLSGIDDFRVINCDVERWGGSGIDMVGCHRGVIRKCNFRNGGDSGIQTKGGTSEISVERSTFWNFGQRAVNIGGSTGLPFFRPALGKMPVNGRYEAKDIRVQGCIFVGGVAPIAFVGVDGAAVRHNTIYNPGRWAVRILQETRQPGFVPSRNGIFERNLIVFQSDRWFEGGINVGSDVAATTFQFANNFWYCQDRPERSQPRLPTPEKGGMVGRNPGVQLHERDVLILATSPARSYGHFAYRE